MSRRPKRTKAGKGDLGLVGEHLGVWKCGREGKCGRQNNAPPQDVHVLVLDFVNMSPYMADGALHV